MRSRLSAAIASAALFVAADARAQAGPARTFPRWDLAAYVGAAHNSLAGTHLGVIPGRDHLFVGLHVTANLVRHERWAIGWAPEFVPLLVVTGNPKYEVVDEFWKISYPKEGTGPVAGFAVSPIGVEGQMRVGANWRFYAAGAAGCVWFARDVPVPRSRAFNYTMEFGGGAIWQFGEKSGLRFGYKFHHLSNWYSARQNPGLDGAVFLVGWQRAIGGQ